MHFYVPLIYLLIAVPYAWLGIYAWVRRPALAVVPFSGLMIALALWSFTYGMEIVYADLPRKLFFTNIEYFSVVLITILLPVFVLEYTGRSHLLTQRNRLLLLIIPGLALMMVWTNPYHHLFWDSEKIIETAGLYLMSVSQGPFFYLFISYSYIIMLLSSVLLVSDMLTRPGVYRLQAALLIMAIMSPFIGGILYLIKMNPIPSLDLTPLFFIPTAVALYWAIIRYRLLDVIPLAHIIVLQNITDGVIVVDERQRVLYMNPTAEMILGRSEALAVGQPLERLSQAGMILDAHLLGREGQFEIRFNPEEDAPTFEATFSPMYLLNKKKPSRYPGSLILLHDITLRKETESALQRREAILAALSTAAEEFLKEAHWEQNIPRVLEKLGLAADVSRVYVFVNYTDESEVIFTSQCYEWAAPGISPQIDNPDLQHLPYRQAGFGEMLEVMSRGDPFLGLVRNLPLSMRPLLAAEDIQSIALMPIFVEREWWGFIGFDECRAQRQWTEVELEALRTAASLFGAAELRARTEGKLLRRQNMLDLRNEIVQVSLEAQDLHEMAQSIANRMVKLIAASDCFLDMWQEENRRLIPLAATGQYQQTYPSYQSASGERSLTHAVLDAGHSLVINDLQNSPYVSSDTSAQFPATSVLALPLIAAGRKLGAMLLTFDNPHRFTAEEIDNGEQAALLVALALAKVTAVTEARRRADESETLRKAGMAVSETLKAEEAVDRILDQLAQVIPYDSASVQILRGSELIIVGGRGWEDPKIVVGMSFPIPGDNPNTRVIQTGQPYLLANAGEHYPTFHNSPHSHIHSWLGVPLVFRNRTVGLLSIDSSKPDYFGQESVDLAAAFAAQVAIALENARLFEEVENLAITDPLTGILNRRGLYELGKVEFARSLRLQRPFSVIMLDLDHFKMVNDTYGHEIGDRVLQEFASRCGCCVRETDFIGRYGGEEIVILLPESDLSITTEVAERLCRNIAEEPFRVAEDKDLTITTSIGVASRDDVSGNLEALIARADQAMYTAKRQGRNRVAVSQ